MPRSRSRSSRSRSSPPRRGRMRSARSSTPRRSPPRKGRKSRSRRRRRSSSASRSRSSDEEAPNRIWVANSDCARIIGRKGETRMDIERQSEASLRISREDEMDPVRKERSIELNGNARQRKIALRLVKKIASFVRDDGGKVLKEGPQGRLDGDAQDDNTIQIRCDEVGRVIGRGGENIKRIEEESGARIEVDRNEGRLEFRGPANAILRARELVLSEVSHAKAIDGKVLKDDGRSTGDDRGGARGGGSAGSTGPKPFRLWVQNKEAGRVIGRGGETVREIMQKTGAQVEVARSDGTDNGLAEREVKVAGSEQQIQEAFEMIIRDVSFVRGEMGVIKSPDMTPAEAEEALRTRGPNGGSGGQPRGLGGVAMGMMPHPGMRPPMGMMPPGMMPPGMVAPPGMMPPPGIPPGMPAGMPGMPPMPGMSMPGMSMPAGMPGMPPGMPPCFPPGMPSGMPCMMGGTMPGNMQPPPSGFNDEPSKDHRRSPSSSSESSRDGQSTAKDCEKCSGSGKVLGFDFKCSQCKGTGKEKRSRKAFAAPWNAKPIDWDEL